MIRRAAARLTLLAFLVTAAPATPCHMPEHLRALEPMLTAAQLALMSHGGASFAQIPYRLDAATPCVDGMADIFPCSGVDLLAHLSLGEIGGGSGNDIWGWVDPMTGAEYAIIGRTSGTSFIDLTDPENPVYLGNLPTHSQSSTWRDIKVYQDHAFVVADFAGSHGIQVFDLTELRNVLNPPVTFSEAAHYGGFDRAHNIAINEATGFAYAVGSETCSGGLHMVDILNPLNPTFVGCFSGDGYTHDAQCVVYSGPDPDYQGREICFASNEDSVTIVDVTDKASPRQLSRSTYNGSGYTHQGWLTDDQRYFIHDDELDELFFGHNTRTYSWDISNLDSPSLAGQFTSDGSSIDHNQYVKGDFTYQANYRRGLRILSIDDPANGGLSEAAYFDTFPDGDGDSFEGAWSVYPFFPSGVVVVSDINRGLFVLQPQLDTEAVLTVSGSCPGSVTITARNMTANGTVAFLRGSGPGSDTLPGGPCAGITSGLANPQLLIGRTADGAGVASLSGNAPSSACGSPLQALDVATCTLTPVAVVP